MDLFGLTPRKIPLPQGEKVRGPMLFRRLLLSTLVLLASIGGPSLAQYQQQQRQDDLGIMSSPQSGQQSSPSMGGQVQQVNPLQTPQVQSPTITNNPDYPRQPIFVPSPYFPYQQFPGQQFQGQLPQQGGRQQGANQNPGQTPAQPGSEQRGRGAFTAPGVTRDLSLERNEFQDFI